MYNVCDSGKTCKWSIHVYQVMDASILLHPVFWCWQWKTTKPATFTPYNISGAALLCWVLDKRSAYDLSGFKTSLCWVNWMRTAARQFCKLSTVSANIFFNKAPYSCVSSAYWFRRTLNSFVILAIEEMYPTITVVQAHFRAAYHINGIYVCDNTGLKSDVNKLCMVSEVGCIQVVGRFSNT